MWKDRIMGRAKRAIRNQRLPLLLTSVKGHTKAINSIDFMPAARIVVRFGGFFGSHFDNRSINRSEFQF